MREESTDGEAVTSGELQHKIIRADDPLPTVGELEAELARMRGGLPPADWPSDPSLLQIVRFGLPQGDLPDAVNVYRRRNARRLWRGTRKLLLARSLRLQHAYGALYATVLRRDGRVEDYGLISVRVVTTAGVGFIVDAFQNLVELETMKYHGLGTGTNAEASGDTALQTELTTEYNPNSTRATGSLTESAANVFRTVGTNTVDASAAVTEHGILSQAATGGGTLLDRSVFSVINLANGDGLQTTYDFTVTAGG